MPEADFDVDLANCLDTLRSGGVILFPTDTIWGIGCDATNADAVEKVLHIKQRHAAQGLITLIADATELKEYVDVISPASMVEIAGRERPTTIIYTGARNVAPNVIPADGTLAIRIVQEPFCQHLIRQFGKPIVSTSANIHGQASPQNFSEIAHVVIKNADYVVQYRQEEQLLFQPSTILKLDSSGVFETIRK